MSVNDRFLFFPFFTKGFGYSAKIAVITVADYMEDKQKDKNHL
jgi:hypothetical protein